MKNATLGPAPGSTRADRPRIFGIGLNKTGTSSLHEALTTLGFKSLHWGGPRIRQAVERASSAGEMLLRDVDPKYDAFSDVQALSTAFEVLDCQYPGSRFVLTVRPIEEWIDSRRRHVENNKRRKAAGEYDGTFLVVDEAGWRKQWRDHIGSARRYFEGRFDYLELDIADEPSWALLCDFLCVDEPREPFPWANRDRISSGGDHARSD